MLMNWKTEAEEKAVAIFDLEELRLEFLERVENIEVSSDTFECSVNDVVCWHDEAVDAIEKCLSILKADTNR